MNINATILAQMLIFAVLVWICVSWIWPMTLRNMVKRETRIADGLAAADKGQKSLADASGRAEALVYKGRVVADGAETKEGQKVVVEGGLPAVASFNKKTQDDLDLWSRERAKALVAAPTR